MEFITNKILITYHTDNESNQCCKFENDKQRKTLISTIKKLIILIIKLIIYLLIVWSLNIYAKDIFIKLLVQFTIGIDTNIIQSHLYYNYVKPNLTVQQCHQYQNRYFQRQHLSLQINCDEVRDEALKIPKIIHQTYKSLENIPSDWNETSVKWKEFHPDWQYIFWSDQDIEEFMNKYYPKYNSILNGYKYKISKVDAWRFFILYHYGGVYSDMDIIPIQNIEPLLSNRDHIFVETPNIGLTNSVMATKKNSRLMKYVMNNLKEYSDCWYMYFMPKHLQILVTAGPTYLWTIVTKYNIDDEHNDHIGIIANKYYGKPGDCDCLHDIEENEKSAYFKHLKGHTWHFNNSWLISIYLHCHPILIIGGCISFIWFIYKLKRLTLFHYY